MAPGQAKLSLPSMQSKARITPHRSNDETCNIKQDATPSHSAKSHNSSRMQNAAKNEDFMRLTKKMHLGCVSGCIRSLSFTFSCLIGSLVTLSLVVTIIWFAIFFDTTQKFGVDLRVQTVEMLHHQLNEKLIAMRAVGQTLSSMGHVIYNDTSSEELTQTALTMMKRLVPDFDRMDTTIFTRNMRDGRGMANFVDPADPMAVRGYSQTKLNDTHVNVYNLQGNFTSNEFHFVRGDDLALHQSYLYPESFLDHVRQLKVPYGFVKPVPFICSPESCMFSFFPFWSHFVDDEGNVVVSAKLSKSISSFSALLDTMTRDNADSFLLTNEGEIIAHSSGLQRILEDEKKWRFYYWDEQDKRGKLLPATRYPDSTVSNIASELHQRYGDSLSAFASQQGKDHIQFEYDGKSVDVHLVRVNRQHTGSTGWPGSTGAHSASPEIYMDMMLLVHSIPSNAFTQRSIIMGSVVISVTLLATILSAIVSVILTCCIRRPMQRLIKQMERVKNLDLDIATNHFAYFTELRSIQAMFYFLVLNLTQYRAFIPSYVLEMIDARQKNFHLHKKKGAGQQQLNSLATVMDEVESETSGQFSETASSQRRSLFGKSTRQSSGHSKHHHLAHQFSVGMFRRNISLLQMKIVNVDTLLSKTQLSDFVHQHSELLETVSKLSSVTKKATLSHFDHETFVVSFNATISSNQHTIKACNMALLLQQRVLRLNKRVSQQGLQPLQVVISVTSGNSFVSTLGTQYMKQQSIFGNASTMASMQLNSMKQLAIDGCLGDVTSSSEDDATAAHSVMVVANHAACEHLLKSNHVSCRIIDLLIFRSIKESDQDCHLHPIYKLQAVGGDGKAREWLYNYASDEDRKSHMEKHAVASEAWKLLMENQLEQVVQLLEKNANEQEQQPTQDNVLTLELEKLVNKVQKATSSNSSSPPSFKQYCADILRNMKRLEAGLVWTSALSVNRLLQED